MHPLNTWLFWGFVVLSLGVFAYSAYVRLYALFHARRANRIDHPWKRLKNLFIYAFAQKRMVRDKYAGFFHLMIFWGFVILLFRSFELVTQGLFPGVHFMQLLGPAGLGYELLKDIFEVLVLVGVALAAIRRIFARPERLKNSWDATFTLAFIALLMISDLGADGAVIAMHHPAWASWAPASTLVAKFMAPLAASQLTVIFYSMWWLHVVTLFGFLNFLPYSKHFHVLTALVNVFCQDLEPNKALKRMDFEMEHFGANRIQDFTWKQMLDLYTCTECGRCKEVCPTTITGKPLKPKDYGNDLRDYLYKTPLKDLAQDKALPEDRPLIGPTISEDTIWACTTCGYCEHACPLFISFVDKLVEMRRYLTLEESNFPEEAQTAFRGMERQGNPWNLPRADRMAWADGLDVPTIGDNPDAEYLFWVGCAGSYDDHGKNVSQSLVKLMRAAGVSFAVLGEEENCTGDSARRLGNEYLFEMMAEGNVEVLNGHGIKKIVTNCPHCLNTLKNEYPQFGGDYDVVHGTQLVSELLATSRLKLTQEVKEALTFHDPCYLARYNKETDAPRTILGAIPGITVTEMEHHGENTMCCGAGGGRMWLEEKLGTRINHERLDQALATGAKGLAVSCPFCNVMLNNAAAETEHQDFVARDVLELAARALPQEA
ncbi:MAG: (Fe-S)-binding protein [Acidobacteriota bacterium]